MGEAKNEHIGLLRRRRYRCPVCNEYKMLITKSGEFLCANGCSVLPVQEEDAIKNRLSDGYFTTTDLEALFGFDFSTYPEIEWSKEHKSLYNRRQLIKLNNINHRHRDADNLLDDVSIEYYRQYPERDKDERELTHYDYFFNIIEDIMVHINLISKDMMLMDFSYQLSLQHEGENRLFSISYYYYCLSQHFYECMERIMLWFGLIYHYSFSEDGKKNTHYSIYKSIKKDPDFNNSGLRTLLETVIGNNTRNILLDWRSSSSHDLSKSLKNLNVDTAMKKQRYQIDVEMFSGNFEGILKITEQLQDLATGMINKIKELYAVTLDYNAINLLIGTGSITKLKISKSEHIHVILTTEGAKLDKYLFSGPFHMSDKENGYLLIDLVCRLAEVIKGCSYAIFFDDEQFQGMWKGPATIIPDIMDRQYLVYTSATLTMACYDKLARIIYRMYMHEECGNYIYFENILEKILVQNPPVELAARIIDHEDNAFKFLAQYRNEFTHILRKGAIYTNAMEDNEDYLIVAIAYNVRHIVELIDTIYK